jgi:hypothetical protein
VLKFFSGCNFSPLAVVVDPDRQNEAYAVMRSRDEAKSILDDPPNNRRIDGRAMSLTLARIDEYTDAHQRQKPPRMQRVGWSPATGANGVPLGNRNTVDEEFADGWAPDPNYALDGQAGGWSAAAPAADLLATQVPLAAEDGWGPAPAQRAAAGTGSPRASAEEEHARGSNSSSDQPEQQQQQQQSQGQQEEGQLTRAEVEFKLVRVKEQILEVALKGGE